MHKHIMDIVHEHVLIVHIHLHMLMSRPRRTSSPEPSTPRPQRASRATSTIGAKVQSMPAALARALHEERCICAGNASLEASEQKMA